MDKILAHKAVSSNGNFLQGHPKPEFSEKVQRGDQGKFFKNRPKTSPRLKGPKAVWRKLHSTLISMHLKCKDWEDFGTKGGSKSSRMAKLWQFWQGHPKPAFSKKRAKGGPREIFLKIAQKLALA